MDLVRSLERSGTARLFRVAGVSASSTSLADVDATVEIGELHFRAAAANSAVDGLVNLDNVFADILPAILDGLLWRGSLNLYIEIAKDFSTIVLEAEVSLQIVGKGQVNLAGQRAEGLEIFVDAGERVQQL